MPPNFQHQTIWTRDNLEVMRGMNSDSVDLIYLDPPFNSGQNYAAPIGSEAAGAEFKDMWTLSDVDLAWHGEIAEEHPALYAILDAAGEAHGKPMKAYLIYMEAVEHCVMEFHEVDRKSESFRYYERDSCSSRSISDTCIRSWKRLRISSMRCWLSKTISGNTGSPDP